MVKLILFVATLASLVASQANAAIIIDSGPLYPPTGGVIFNSNGVNPGLGSLVRTYSGLDLSQTANLYFGLSNGVAGQGISMNGGGISGLEQFGAMGHSVSGNTLTLNGQTTMIDIHGTHTLNTQLRITIAGTGSWITDSTTLGLGTYPRALWDVQSDFTATIQMLSQDPHNGFNFAPYISVFNSSPTIAGFTQHSLSTAFYEQANPVPEPASLAIWGGLGIAGLVAARRRKKVAA